MSAAAVLGSPPRSARVGAKTGLLLHITLTRVDTGPTDRLVCALAAEEAPAVSAVFVYIIRDHVITLSSSSLPTVCPNKGNVFIHL